MHSKIVVYCKVHDYYYSVMAQSLTCGCGCKYCKADKIGLNQRKAPEEYKKEIYGINPNIILLTPYVSAKKKIRVRCKLDGYEWDVAPFSLYRSGCPCCSGKVAISNVNDIKATHPFIFDWIHNKNIPHTHGSKEKIEFQCPDCGYIFTSVINNVCNRGIHCPQCGDSTSIGEKIMTGLLNELNINYIYQYKPYWSEGKFYDYYIPGTSSIIEVHGLQHYDSKPWHGMELTERQRIDNFKHKNALKNGIENYIIVDARYSTINYIKDNIMNSLLSKSYDLVSLDWNNIMVNAFKSKIKECVDLWNNGVTIPEIAIKLGNAKSCVREHLKIGDKLGLCEYKPVTTAKPCVCSTTKKIFKTMADGAKEYGINKVKNITDVCNGNSDYVEQFPDGTKLQWEYYDENKNYDGFTYVS